ncbi:sigma-70 family RNA polymerase sigma factor [Bradyrhizobium mercantei]|uniref:sigma-70 family RNA polymerase sigma factor n=1 Tax=Bradyrhizobium mercantei TaxID=1904807 RepID=UPI0009768FA2|nr:sigma-70 family RNA polymerase sigma factor [Bradyrhizobium mercantei]
MTGGEDHSSTNRWAALLALAEELRPELHRYCSRLVGSVIEGEDVVQDTFAKAFVAMEAMVELPQLRAWLFRIAHNRALDVLRSKAIRAAEPIEAAYNVVDGASPDPVEQLMHQEAVRTAVSRFAELPILQRSVIILKDVLDEPLADIASLLGLTIDSVKAHLARGRARLREINATASPPPDVRSPSAAVMRYVTLFNQRDWDGLRAMLADDVKLNQSAHPVRIGRNDVGMFFSIYGKMDRMRLAPAWLEGREVIAVFESGIETKPSYFMWLEWRGDEITFIRDYRYVRYIMADAELTFSTDSGTHA